MINGAENICRYDKKLNVTTWKKKKKYIHENFFYLMYLI